MMSTIGKFSSAKSGRAADKSSAGENGVVAHRNTKLRDLENLMRYVKKRDEERGID